MGKGKDSESLASRYEAILAENESSSMPTFSENPPEVETIETIGSPHADLAFYNSLRDTEIEMGVAPPPGSTDTTDATTGVTGALGAFGADASREAQRDHHAQMQQADLLEIGAFPYTDLYPEVQSDETVASTLLNQEEEEEVESALEETDEAQSSLLETDEPDEADDSMGVAVTTEEDEADASESTSNAQDTAATEAAASTAAESSADSSAPAASDSSSAGTAGDGAGDGDGGGD